MCVVASATLGVILTRSPVAGGPVEVLVPAGATTSSVGELLHSRGVIESALQFKIWSRIKGLDGQIRAGKYNLRSNLGARRALEVLGRGPIEKTVSVTIPEGYTVKQIAPRVDAKLELSEEDFLEAATSGQIKPPFDSPENSLEGFLYPDTYTLSPDETSVEVIQRMIDNFNEKTADLNWTALADRGITPYQALIVASLIEREAKVDEDRAKVSAVIYNRLKKPMRLQIDITALYDAPRHKVPTKQDLKRESPYNTYLNDGLPPTPIANPGLPSIRAALEPANINALYYVLIDKVGHHGFADTFAEFQRLRQSCPKESCG